MTIRLDLPPEIEAKVAARAEARGLPVPDYLLTEIEHLVAMPEPVLAIDPIQAEKNKAALAVLRQQREQDATDDPEELERRRIEWEEFKQALNESHTSSRILFP